MQHKSMVVLLEVSTKNGIMLSVLHLNHRKRQEGWSLNLKLALMRILKEVSTSKPEPVQHGKNP